MDNWRGVLLIVDSSYFTIPTSHEASTIATVSFDFEYPLVLNAASTGRNGGSVNYLRG